MMQERLRVVEVGLARNRAHAQATDVFDAALLDEVGDDVEGLVEVVQVVRLEVGNGAEYSPPGADLARHAREPLLGTEVQGEAAPRVKLRGNLREAGSFGGCGGRRGGFWRRARRRFFLLAAGDGEQRERGKRESRCEGVESFHSRVQ